MKKILITGAGGTPSTNFIRSLRDSRAKLYFIGVDCNKYYLSRAETEKKYLVPKANSKNYLPILKSIIDQTKPDFLYSQPDQEIFEISKCRDLLNVKTFLPKHKTIEICQNKFSSYEVWKNAGLKVPDTMIINNARDISKAFKKYGSPIWLRAVVSPGGGVGSIRANSFELAKAWINYCDGWKNFTAARCLKSDTITWMSIWKNGKLIVAQGRKRVYWEFANRAPSGVTGITGTGVTVSNSALDKLAIKAIKAIDKSPQGVFSVDFTFDKNMVPNPTEINIGRFFTTHYFFTKAGINMPYIFIKAAFDEKLPKIKKKINPLAPGLAWVRGMDFHPVLVDSKQFDRFESELKQRRQQLKNEVYG